MTPKSLVTHDSAMQAIQLAAEGREQDAYKALEAVEPPMSESNRLIAYCAAVKLRELGFTWDEENKFWKPSGTEALRAKVWKLLDELEEVRNADPGEEYWGRLNAADDDLRITLEAYDDGEPCSNDSDLLDWLEEQVKKSFTGVTFTYSKVTVDGQVLEKGYKFLCRHFIGDCRSSLRAAAYAAKAAIESKEE